MELPDKPHYNAKAVNMKEAMRLYFDEQLPLATVGKLLEVSGQTILYRFRKYGINARTKSEWQTGRKRPELSRENNPNWKGGKSQTCGYLKLNANTREHRQIAETVLGRKLKSTEIVHHIDGNGCNNRHDNLLICTQSYHVLLHTRMEANNG